MVRKILIPTSLNISIQVPKEYIGKKVEVIAFTIDEVTEKSNATDSVLTHLASEKILAKDWLSLEEDKAWQDL